MAAAGLSDEPCHAPKVGVGQLQMQTTMADLGDGGRYAIEDMKTAERIHQIEEVEYELAVRDESTGYFGSWFCRACWKGGVVYDLMPSVNDAMTQAEQRANDHHESAHPKKQLTDGH